MVNLNTNSKMTPPLSYEQMILSEIRGLKDDIRELRNELKETKCELNGRMDKFDGRMDRLKDNFNGRMNKLENEVRNSSRHTQIMTVTVVGIVLAVIYFVFTH